MYVIDYFIINPALPQIEKARSNKTLQAEIGDDILFVGGMAVNPEPLSFAIKIPGKKDRIESENPGDMFDFTIKKPESNLVSIFIFRQLTILRVKKLYVITKSI